MKHLVLFATLLATLTNLSARGQSVVINEFRNATPDVVELLVIENNLDMRGMILKDYSSSGANDNGGGYTFSTNALWSSLPAGTLIVLRRELSATDITVGGSDFNLDVGVSNTTYFTVESGTFDIAAQEILMIKAAGSGKAGSTGVIHAFASGNAKTNVNFTGVASAKLATASGDSGANESAEAGNTTQALSDFDGTDATGDGATGSIGTWNNANNQAYILTLRGGGGGPATNVQFTASSAAIGEAGNSFTVTVVKTIADGNVSAQITLGGTATLTTDYTISTTNITLNGATTSATVIVSIVDDGDTENNETVVLNLANVTGGTLGTPGAFTLTINDNDALPPPSGSPWINEMDYDSPGTDTNEWVEIAGPAGLSLNDYELVFVNNGQTTGYNSFDLGPANWTFSDEGNGYGFFVIGRVNPLEGTADFSPATWTQDEIQNGPGDSIVLRQKTGPVNVHTLDYEGNNAILADDQITTASDDNASALTSIYLTGGPGSGFADFGWTNIIGNATPGTINNAQTLTPTAVTTNLKFSAASATVGEASGTYLVTIVKTAPDGNLTAQLALGGTATLGGGNDYTIDATNVTLNGATTSATVTITINDDAVIELAETVILTLTNAVGGGLTAPSVFTLTITDNDALPLNPLPTNVILHQRFEVGDPWSITDGSSLVSATDGATDFPPLQRIQQGVQSWQVNNASVTLALEQVSIAGFTNRAIKARLSSTAGTAVNGADSGDLVRFYVAVDGEAFDSGSSPDFGLSGNLNARWGYWATGVVDVIAGTTNSFSPAVGGQSTNNISTVFIRLPDAATSVALRVWARNDSVDEIWNLDNIEIVGEAGVPPAGVPPVLSAIGNKTTLTNALLTFAVSATATDGDPVVMTVSNAPGGSTFGTTNTAGTFTWAAPGPAGVYTVTFYAADDDGADSETITITVTNTPAGPGGGGMQLNLWFNELHYDNVGGDTNEGFEIAGPAGTDLSGYTVFLYDGTTLTTYSNIPLSGVIPNQSNGYGVIWVEAAYNAAGSLQNGTNDALALVYQSTGVIQFIGYEGSTTPVNGPAAGIPSINIGAQSSTAIGITLSLCGTGTNYAEMVATGGWQTNTQSRGAFSPCQVIPAPAGGGNDDDGDLIPNDWEIQYFGSATGATATVDTDGDGFINLDEYIAGTIPNNSNSFFEVNNLTPSGSIRVLEFATVTGRLYQVLYTTNLITQTWTDRTNGIIGTGGFYTLGETNEGNRIYQIRTRLNLP